MIKPQAICLPAIMVSVLTADLQAETLSFPTFQVEIQDGWRHSIETHPVGVPRRVIRVVPPDGTGVLKLGTYNSSTAVSPDSLRNLTNLDPSIPLPWQRWGDLSGYQYSYTERGTYFRQWWLTDNRTLLFITFSDVHPEDAEVEAIDRIVRSITTSNAQM